MEREPGLPDDGAWPDPQAAASPFLTPDPAETPRGRAARIARELVDAARRHRAAVVVAALVAAGVLAYALAPSTTVVLPDAVDGGRVLAPLKTAADPRTGEQTAPFTGFAVSVETIPPGALVTIDGVERGEAPVLAGLDCAPGARVEIAARKAGLSRARVATTCRADTLVKLTVRLSR